MFGITNTTPAGGGRGVAIQGNCDLNGVGVVGQAIAFTGAPGTSIGTGVMGVAEVQIGVMGTSAGGFDSEGNRIGGLGVVGNGANVGVQGESNGTGVMGLSRSTIGVGVYGDAASPDVPNATTGVFGRGQNIGVAGVVNGASGTAVAGFGGSDTSNTGVYGESGAGSAVIGRSNSGFAVFGASESGIGVYASSTTGNSLIVNGNAYVYGALYSPAKFFRIDMPGDGTNKYLFHASVESAERKNLYDGISKLDENAEAVIELPDWFEALNGEIRYQLTSVGGPAPDLHVAQELANCQFRIAGGRPGMRVCWQVTGVRRDALARYEPMRVVKDKPPHERGYYQNPEAHGQPRELGIAHLLSAPHIRPPEIPLNVP